MIKNEKKDEKKKQLKKPVLHDKSCGVVPVYREGNDYKFLLIQLVKGEHWSFPKGHPENNETELETAEREFQEETGITNYKIFPDVSFSENYFFMQGKTLINKTVKYFLCLAKSNIVNLQPEEVIDHKWLNYKEAVELATYQPTKQMLKDAKKYLKNHDLGFDDSL